MIFSATGPQVACDFLCMCVCRVTCARNVSHTSCCCFCFPCKASPPSSQTWLVCWYTFWISKTCEHFRLLFGKMRIVLWGKKKWSRVRGDGWSMGKLPVATPLKNMVLPPPAVSCSPEGVEPPELSSHPGWNVDRPHLMPILSELLGAMPCHVLMTALATFFPMPWHFHPLLCCVPWVSWVGRAVARLCCRFSVFEHSEVLYS